MKNFRELLIKAKLGDNEATEEILELYKALIYKESTRNTYKIKAFTFYYCIIFSINKTNV